jgi:DMSO/TMAO reductase YedYZ molybdopterin-dependent catalytic subunit
VFARRPPRWAAAVAGVLAAGTALGVGELTAGVVGGRSLVVAVGDWVIDHAPHGLVEFGKRNFGTDDKSVLVATIVVASLLLGAGLGLASRRRLLVGAVGIGGFGLVGLLAAAADPLHSTGAALVAAVAAVGSGIATLRALLRTATTAYASPGDSKGPEARTSPDRRAFLAFASGALVVGGLSAAIGRNLLSRGARAVAAARANVHIPRARSAARRPAPAMSVDVEGVTPLVTGAADFYRIDTALTYPDIDHETWRLHVGGMVRQPYTLGFDDLTRMELVEQYVTIGCVSNEVGGNLVSTALWRGVRLRDLLHRAGVRPDADQVVGRSVDGFTVGFPTAAALDDRGAMVAVAMNGEPLPIAHGFPARLIVPGLYGYVSATKWLAEIVLTRFDAFDAYWIERGWARHGPIRTQSRIDVPSPRRSVRAGTVPVAGVAWAPTRGISQVEVQVDEQDWRPARLAEELAADTWRQWVYRWDATPGSHRLRVRATDGTGTLQDGRERPPEPSGATGYHTVHVTVT